MPRADGKPLLGAQSRTPGVLLADRLSVSRRMWTRHSRGCAKAGSGAALALLVQQRRRAHDQRVGSPDDALVLIVVGDPAHDATPSLDPGPLLVVALPHGPPGTGP